MLALQGTAEVYLVGLFAAAIDSTTTRSRTRLSQERATGSYGNGGYDPNCKNQRRRVRWVKSCTVNTNGRMQAMNTKKDDGACSEGSGRQCGRLGMALNSVLVRDCTVWKGRRDVRPPVLEPNRGLSKP
ncbi:hypothetical protein U1Q18_029889 [Sarracenia purpurea var. burkii]